MQPHFFCLNIQEIFAHFTSKNNWHSCKAVKSGKNYYFFHKIDQIILV